MRTLYLDCGMGAAGDMLLAALYELAPDREGFLRKMAELGLPGVEVKLARAESHGIAGTHAAVTVHGLEEDEHLHGHEGHGHGHEQPHEHPHEHGHDHGHDHGHEHEHDHGHGHVHEHEHEHEHAHEHEHGHHHHGPHLSDVLALIGSLPVSERVREDACAVYRAIAEAEGEAHGAAPDMVHFHEVGSLDAIADVVGVSLLMEAIAPERVVASPVRVGYGTVRCAHGLLSVPAPATASLLKGVPIYAGALEGEMCTPTGAALLKHFATEFGHMPEMETEAVGVGLGTRDFGTPNCLRAFLGESRGGLPRVSELRCNIDDATPEELGFAMDVLLENGALDVFTVPIGMKKNRPATLLCCLCAEDKEEEMGRLLLRHTPTLGVRIYRPERMTLSRGFETAETRFGPVRVKTAEGWGVSKRKAEYDDIARIARENGLTLAEARAEAEK